MRSLALALVGIALVRPACCMKEELDIEDDYRRTIVVDNFGFHKKGQISLKMKDLQVQVEGELSLVQGNEIGILVANVGPQELLEIQEEEEQSSLCLPDIARIEPLKQWAWDTNTDLNMEYTIPAGRENEYTIFFYNCKEKSKVSFHLDIELYNTVNGKRNYLSAGDTALPNVWFGFSFLFFVGLIYWSLGLRNSWAHKQQIHLLMTVLVVLKVLTMLVDGIKLTHMAREGTGSGWDYLWFALYGVKGATLFIVIVLIGSGWSFVKPFLSERDKKIVMIILPLQVVNNIALVVTEEENMGNQDWAAWRDVLHLFDIICCCAILFPIVWSIKHLREAAATDGKAAVNAEKLTLFRQFYMLVVSYIYFTRIIVFLLGTTLEWEHAYWATVATQAATFVFYAVTGYKFRPMSANPYLRISQEDEEELRQLEMEQIAMENGSDL